MVYRRCILHFLKDPGCNETCNARFYIDLQKQRVLVETISVGQCADCRPVAVLTHYAVRRKLLPLSRFSSVTGTRALDGAIWYVVAFGAGVHTLIVRLQRNAQVSDLHQPVQLGSRIDVGASMRQLKEESVSTQLWKTAPQDSTRSGVINFSCPEKCREVKVEGKIVAQFLNTSSEAAQPAKAKRGPMRHSIQGETANKRIRNTNKPTTTTAKALAEEAIPLPPITQYGSVQMRDFGPVRLSRIDAHVVHCLLAR